MGSILSLPIPSWERMDYWKMEMVSIHLRWKVEDKWPRGMTEFIRLFLNRPQNWRIIKIAHYWTINTYIAIYILYWCSWNCLFRCHLVKQSRQCLKTVSKVILVDKNLRPRETLLLAQYHLVFSQFQPPPSTTLDHNSCYQQILMAVYYVQKLRHLSFHFCK